VAGLQSRRGVGKDAAAQRVPDRQVEFRRQGLDEVVGEIAEAIVVGARAGTVSAQVDREHTHPVPAREPLGEILPEQTRPTDAVDDRCGALTASEFVYRQTHISTVRPPAMSRLGGHP